MIYLKDIFHKLDNFDLNLSIEIKKGEIFGLIGKSGSGKTTILKIIQNLIKINKGELIFSENFNISTIFQEVYLLNNKTVFENIILPLKINKTYNKNKTEEVEKVLRFVGLFDKRDIYPYKLSGGEKQRIAIARALIINPDILLCDEPTASLDRETTMDILSLFLKINKKYNTTIIIVSHELEVVKKICNRVAVIDKGKILETISIKNNDLIQNMNYLDYVKGFLL